MRTNKLGVTEVASIRANQETFMQEHERIHGPEAKKFCDVCEMRLSYCECPKIQKILIDDNSYKEAMAAVAQRNKRVLAFVSEYEALCEKHHFYVDCNFTEESFEVSDIHSPKWDRDSMFKFHLDELKNLKDY